MSSLLAAMTHRRQPLSRLADEDRVVLFPSLAYDDSDGKHCIVEVHGDVFAPARLNLGRRVVLRVLKRAMRASDEALASPLFQERIARFVARNRSGLRIAVQIGDLTYPLPAKTGRTGHFHAAIRVPACELAQAACAVHQRSRHASGTDHDNADPAKVVPLAVRDATGLAVATGQALWLPPRGLSIISDIDDTLKHSQVTCRRTLLANTFLRPFLTIPGMSALFRSWAAAGAAFHYVSSSPWQLYQHLAEHLAFEGFPPGSFHLRPFLLRTQLLRRLLLIRRSGKLISVRSLMRMFPQRQFVLVGDSGERDPEMYGAIARRFPQQIAGIFIRELAGDHPGDRRLARAFQGVNRSLVHMFRHPRELEAQKADILSRARGLDT